MRKRKAVRIISYLIFALAAVSFTALSQYEKAELYRGYAELNYSHAFIELSTAMGDIDDALQKSVYATSPALAGALCAEVYAKCQTARMALGVLPLDNGEVEQTSGFINRAGDYALSLTKTLSGGISGEQRQNLTALSQTASSLRQSIDKLRPELELGSLSYERLEETAERSGSVSSEENAPELRDLSAGTTDTGRSCLGDGMLQVEQEFPEAVPFVYDGAFSAAHESARPRMTEGLETIDENAARAAAARFLGIPEGRVSVEGKNSGGVAHWLLSSDVEGTEQIVAVTEQGGLPLFMLRSSSVGEPTLSEQEAVAAAERFLERRGYRAMTPISSSAEDGVLNVSFVWRCGEALCYPDLIKLRIAMDSGAVVGFDAAAYVSGHYSRDLMAPTVSREEAAAALPEGLAIQSGALAVIATAGGEERLCHEFGCIDEGGRRCLIYVNAFSGQQEDILLLEGTKNAGMTA